MSAYELERRRHTRRKRLAAASGVGAIALCSVGAVVVGERSAEAAAPEPTAVVVSQPDPVYKPKFVPPTPKHHFAIPPVWYRLSRCESSGNWHDTSGMFEGGVQFLNSTWLSNGGARYAPHAYEATPREQITIARHVLAGAGPGAWPVCGPIAGLQRGE